MLTSKNINLEVKLVHLPHRPNNNILASTLKLCSFHLTSTEFFYALIQIPPPRDLVPAHPKVATRRYSVGSNGQARETNKKNRVSNRRRTPPTRRSCKSDEQKRCCYHSGYRSRQLHAFPSVMVTHFGGKMSILLREPPSRNKPESLACSPSVCANAAWDF